jgi:hypothetical protein
MLQKSDDPIMDNKNSDVAVNVESSTAILNQDIKVNVTVVFY